MCHGEKNSGTGVVQDMSAIDGPMDLGPGAEVKGFSAAVNVAEAAKKWPLAVHLLMQDILDGYGDMGWLVGGFPGT